LFSWPLTTWSRTCRSRGVRDSYRDFSSKAASLEERLPAQLERGPDGRHQHALADGFLEEIDGSLLHRARGQGNASETREEHRRGNRSFLFQLFVEIESRDPGQTHVEQQTQGTERKGERQKRSARIERFDVIASETKLTMELPPHEGSSSTAATSGRPYISRSRLDPA
jgi:hypothetical protein